MPEVKAKHQTAAAEPTFVLLLRIDAVERRSEQVWRRGVGKDAQFESVDLGWFARSGILVLALGPDHPGWAVGDIIEVRKRQTSSRG